MSLATVGGEQAPPIPELEQINQVPLQSKGQQSGHLKQEQQQWTPSNQETQVQQHGSKQGQLHQDDHAS